MKKKIPIVLSFIFSEIITIGFAVKYIKKLKKEKEKKIEKFRTYYNLLNKWLSIKQLNGKLSEYFNSNGYKSIAIYGMGELGKQLQKELENTDINVKYAVDEDLNNSVYNNIKIIGKEDNWSPVDAVIVTAVFAYSEIKDNIKEKYNYSIISLEEVVNNCIQIKE